MEQRESPHPQLPEGQEPVPVDFHEIPPIAPGVATRQGEYTSHEGDTLVLTGAARQEDADDLDHFLASLRFWAQVSPEQVWPAEKTEPDERPTPEPLADIVSAAPEGEEDAAVVLALFIEPAEETARRWTRPFAFDWLVDPPGAKNELDCYFTKHRKVDVSVAPGDRIRFRWPDGVRELPPNLADLVVGRHRYCYVRILSRTAYYTVSGATWLW